MATRLTLSPENAVWLGASGPLMCLRKLPSSSAPALPGCLLSSVAPCLPHPVTFLVVFFIRRRGSEAPSSLYVQQSRFLEGWLWDLSCHWRVAVSLCSLTALRGGEGGAQTQSGIFARPPLPFRGPNQSPLSPPGPLTRPGPRTLGLHHLPWAKLEPSRVSRQGWGREWGASFLPWCTQLFWMEPDRPQPIPALQKGNRGCGFATGFP